MNFSAKRFAKEVNSWQLKRTWLTRSLRKYLIRGGCWVPRRRRYRAAATAAVAAAAGQVTLLHSQVGISEEEWLLFRWLRLQWIAHSNLIYFICSETILVKQSWRSYNKSFLDSKSKNVFHEFPWIRTSTRLWQKMKRESDGSSSFSVANNNHRS